MRHPISFRNFMLSGSAGVVFVLLLASSVSGDWSVSVWLAGAASIAVLAAIMFVLYRIRGGLAPQSQIATVQPVRDPSMQVGHRVGNAQIVLAGIVMPLVISAAVGFALDSLIPALIAGALMSASGVALLIVVSRRPRNNPLN